MLGPFLELAQAISLAGLRVSGSVAV